MVNPWLEGKPLWKMPHALNELVIFDYQSNALLVTNMVLPLSFNWPVPRGMEISVKGCGS